MLDTAVKITRVSSQAGFDPLTTFPIRAEVVVYMVGDHGPFNLVVPAGQVLSQYVEDETRKKAAELRTLGLVP